LFVSGKQSINHTLYLFRRINLEL